MAQCPKPATRTTIGGSFEQRNGAVKERAKQPTVTRTVELEADGPPSRGVWDPFWNE